MISARFMLVGLLSLASGACAACTGNATRNGSASQIADGKRCCFDDLIFVEGKFDLLETSGMGCKAGEWVLPGGACTIKKDGKMAGSIKCGHPVKTNGKFEIECNGAKGKYSTSYSSCDAAATTGGTTSGGAATNKTGTTSSALQLAVFSAPTFALVALVALGV